MADWSAPPTEEEKKAAGWDTPPTPEEHAAASATEPTFMDRVATGTRKFFDPTYGTNEPNDMGPVGRQTVKALGLMLGARFPSALGMFGSGATVTAADQDWSNPVEAAKQTAIGGGEGVVLGKTLQGVGWAAGKGLSALGRGVAAAEDPAGPLTESVRNYVLKSTAERTGAAPVLKLGNMPTPAEESATVIQAIKDAAKKVEVVDKPAAPGYVWTQPAHASAASGPTPAQTSHSYAIQVAPTQAITTTAPVPYEIPGVAAKVLPTGNTKSASAAFLEGKGARLTVGQKNPASPIAQLEDASTSLPDVGQAIANQKGEGIRSVQYVAMNSARAPGAKAIKPSGDLWTDLDTLASGYDRAYDAFRGIEIYPAVHGPGGGAIQGTGQTPGIISKAIASVDGIDQHAKDIATSFVENQLTRLPPRQGAVGKVDLGDILRVRSNVRAQIRNLARSRDVAALDRKAAFEAAEDALTSVIDTQLPPEVSQALKSVDAMYRNYKMVEDAMWAAGTRPGGFTANELEQGLRRATSRGGFSRGHAGEMWEIVKAWKDVTQPTSGTPQTGVRPIVLDLIDDKLGIAKAKAMARAQAIAAANRQLMGTP